MTARRSNRDDQIKAILLPVLKSYSLGYLSWISPKLFRVISKSARNIHSSRTNGASNGHANGSSSGSGNGKAEAPAPASTQLHTARSEALEIFKKSFDIHRFPAFCGTVMLLFCILERVLQKGNLPGGGRLSPDQRRKLARLLAGTISSGAGLALLQGDGKHSSRPAGRTIDLTTFAVIRALDVLVGSAWAMSKERRVARGKFTRAEGFLEGITDSAVFAASSGVIMYFWFFKPYRLPRAYQKWITSIADVEPRIIEALKRVWFREFIYGEETGQADLLGSYSVDLGLPYELGDPCKTVPVPCLLVHSGHTANCERNALHRFWKAWKFSFIMYMGLNLLVRIKSLSRPSGLWHAFINSVRSSTFLGAFVAFFWYSVCLVRNRIGGNLGINPMFLERWEVIIGCFTCGWSILFEDVKRRAEIAFFVAPRALSAMLPRTYDRKYEWMEMLAFAASTGVVFTAVKENPKRVRGVLGRVLKGVMG